MTTVCISRFRTLVPVGITLLASHALAWTSKPVKDDPLVRMPGTQPGQVVDLESDKQCLSCNGGFEPDHWRGTVMAQAGRDPIFWAGLTVAAQDAIWALGTPNAADICVRCHFPMGWLDGRSDPVNASLMRGEDYEGVSCKICHYMYDPFYQTTYTGTRRRGLDQLLGRDRHASPNRSRQEVSGGHKCGGPDQTLQREQVLFQQRPDQSCLHGERRRPYLSDHR